MSYIPPRVLKKRPLVNERITELYGWTAESLAASVPDDFYGIKELKNQAQYFREAYAYRLGGLGGHDKLYHLINMIKLDLPFFQFVSRGHINVNALRVLKACVEHDDLGVAGAASTGKTYPVGAYILQDWKSAPHATLSFVCTTSMAASEDRIWGAIVKMWQNSVHKIGTYVPHKYVITWGKFSESASDRDFNASIKALAIEEGREGKKAIDTLRGRKQYNVRLVFDELPEMEIYVTQGAINLEANTRDEQINAWGLQVIGIGNPHDPNDAHGQMCQPDHALGFKSVTKETPEWKTRTGWCIFLNGEWSPNFEADENEPLPFPRLTNRRGLANMLKRCHNNENSLEYWRNAIGFWPDSSVIKTILTIELIQAKNADKGVSGKDQPKWRTITRRKICGFDTGFTAGGDKCVANFGEVGKLTNGRMIVAWMAERTYHAEIGKVFEDTIAKQLVDDCILFGVEPKDLGIDISGDGGKMLAAIIRYWITKNPTAAEVFAISSTGTPTERIVSNVDKRKCCDAFDRRVTEYWMMVRESVLCEIVRNMPLVNETDGGLHPIVDQLCSRIYEVRGKKFSIETKDDYKERTSKGSPDNADAFVYMIEMARRAGLTFETPDDRDRREERSEYRKEQSVHSRLYTYSGDGDWGEREDPDDLLAA